MRDAIQFFYVIVGIFFILYLVGYATFLFASVVVGSSELYGAKRRNFLKNELENRYYVPVSILVPCHNENVTVVDTVRSLLSLDYRLYEIVLIDDGSTDDTAMQLRKAFSLKPIHRPIKRVVPCQPEEGVYETHDTKAPITLICKRHGGKADSLNMGINACRYPYYVSMDADSILQRDSLEKIVRPVLEDDDVVAVGGAVRPGNEAVIHDGNVSGLSMPRNVLACMQVLEYDRSFLAARILLDRFNGCLIIAGAFGLFKKSVVISSGGYNVNTMGEDMELVVRLHAFCRENDIPYRIRYATDAICWTQVPERFGDLRRQRRRWQIGLFQSMMDHRQILANPKYGLVSFISYFYFLIYELLSPYIEIFGILTVLFATFVDLLNVPFMVLLFIIYVAYSGILSLTAFFARTLTIDLELKPVDVLKAIGLCILEVAVLRFVLAWVRGTALIGYRRDKQEWGRIERQQINFG